MAKNSNIGQVKLGAISRRLKARTRFGDHAKKVNKVNEVPGVISQAEIDRGKAAK